MPIKNINIIPAKYIKRVKKRVKEKELEPKGTIDPNTYRQLKGLLDTSKIVIERIPTHVLKQIDIQTIKHLESITNNAISILENTNIGFAEIKPRLQETNRIITNLRNKYNYADTFVKVCDTRSIEIVSDLEKQIDRHRDLSSEINYKILSKDLKNMKKYFTDLCKCQPLILKRINL